MHKIRELVFIPCSQIAIRIQVADGGLERGVILTIRMSRVFGDGMGPAHGYSTEAGDDVEHFAFVTGIRIRTKSKHEGTGGHKVGEFRDFSRKFGRRFDSGIAGLFLGTKGGVRGVGIGFEFLDAAQCFPVGGDEIVVFGDGGFADTGRWFRVIIGGSRVIRSGRRSRAVGYGSRVPLGRHSEWLLIAER